MSQKTLLVLGAGPDQMFMIRTAKAMGCKTLALDQNPRAPGFALADDFAVVSTRNVPAILRFLEMYRVQKGPVHGVSTMGSDIPHVVAEIAEHLGTPSISRRSARWATDKFEMKERFRQAGLKIPRYALVFSQHEVQKVLTGWGRPVVVKPVDQAGSRGVSLVRRVDEAGVLFDHALKNSNSGRVLAEEFIAGPQISTESLMLAGEIHTPGYADRNYEDWERFFPQIMENGGWVPSLHEEKRVEVETEVKKAALALEITDGVIKGDVVLGPDGPVIIEVAARLSGGDFCESLVPLGSGVNYVESVIRLALRERPDPVDLVPRFSRTVANRYFFASSGVLGAVHGLEEVAAQKTWVAKLELWYQPGDRLPDIRSHGQRTGVFVVTGPDRNTVQQRVNWVYRTVRFEVRSAA